MQNLTVYIDDNFHYMDSSARIMHGKFETIEAAIEACEKIVNGCVESLYKPNMTAEKLYSLYVHFGDDPWISGVEGVPFSAWDYAKQRCHELCAKRL